MKRSGRHRGGETTAAIWLAAVGLGAAAAAVGVWTGCAVTPQNYEVLRFFFDGVPDPTLPPGAVGRGGEVGGPVFVIVHRPFAEEKCDACHRTRYRPSRNDSSICMECHGSVPTEHPRMHGPVVAGACLWCHNPHESSHAALLRDADRKVCGQCHVPSSLDTERVPEHADASRACLDCHSGHGSDAPFLLKPGPVRGAPTSSGSEPPGKP